MKINIRVTDFEKPTFMVSWSTDYYKNAKQIRTALMGRKFGGTRIQNNMNR